MGNSNQQDQLRPISRIAERIFWFFGYCLYDFDGCCDIMINLVVVVIMIIIKVNCIILELISNVLNFLIKKN
jgi:hypothetical protein